MFFNRIVGLFFVTLVMYSYLHAGDSETSTSRALVLWSPSEDLRTQESAFASSWNTQKMDAGLHDFSDPLGIMWLLNDSKKIDVPLLFRMIKEGKESYLLGTCHNIPASHFSEKILRVFKSCNSFVTEGTSPTRAVWKAVGALSNNKSYETWWIHKLERPVRQHLEAVLRVYYTQKPRDFFLWELSPKGASLFYYAATMCQGMDYDFEKMIPGPISSLETLEEAISLAQNALPPMEIQDFVEKITVDIQRGGELNNPWARKFLFDFKEGRLECSMEEMLELCSSSSGIAQRNKNWVNKWDNLFDTLPGPTLFAVGAMHLFGNYGLSNLLIDSGYTIIDYNSGRNVEKSWVQFV